MEQGLTQTYQQAYQQAWTDNIIWLLLGVLIYFIILRLVLSVPIILRHQKAQTALLHEIAKKVNVEQEAIDKITTDFDNGSIL